ncbi:aldehyde dehydrogenase family protein [Paenibacillus aceris]|uniref:Aldehyde dehydrogenase (NAD+) n=1 Tax=Paenibacillus aceris TaxID=869555 RepID=A0ABS4I5H7_9BACL|nr:aldehyde dehydrogenase family protein [Paenibacillus aceris]MBP1966160.1 aldehyde dehydrogenase (NAD+) [Paenibacillus aceris]NHW33315.1 aldehyde dehydrogenase [Paenibacillus aceris]
MPDHEMLNWLQEASGQTYGNYINGEWRPANSGRTFQVVHAAEHERVIGYFADSDTVDVNNAVEAADAAFTSWSALPGPERGAILLRFADLMELDRDELAFRLSAEQGKTIAESRGEVARAAKEARFAAGEASRILGETVPSERRNVRNTVVRYPIGVVAAIAPWNFPVVTPVRKIAPALAYGCTIVFKPASATPWASARLMELFTEAGVPSGVVNMVTGGGSRVGDPLTKHPRVKGISFTGSTELGLRIQQTAAVRLARTQLELGGKNAAVVLNYTDLGGAAKQIVSAAFACSGQRCTSISRVVVLKSQADKLTEALLQEVKQLRVGPAWEPGIHMGPLVNKEQLESVQRYVRLGKEEGAELLYGGEVLSGGTYENGSYMEPALFVKVTENMTIAREEIFGPVLTVIEANTKEDALRIANGTDYGLAASVFTDELSDANEFAARLEAGMVHVNHGTASEAHMPFGGVKQSGFGAFSIGSTNQQFYTEHKVIYTLY